MTELKPKVTQTANFKRNGIKDLVTGNIIYGDWEPPKTTLPAVPAPTIAGYTPNITEVPALDVTGDSSDTEAKIIYTPVGSTIVVNYVDEDANGKVLKTDTVNGTFGEQTTYSPQSVIDSFTAQNYVVSNNGFPAQAPVFQETPLTYTISFKHATLDVTPDAPDGVTDLTRTVTRTIEFTDSPD